MKLKEIQNGSLYYNKQRKRVERVISNNISNSRVLTEYHKRSEKTVQLKHLRKATDIEVSKYLNGKRGFFGRLSELFCL
mgnify:FL=1|jgi:hypothetical protein|tara:strand:- start:2209 stop:2445 length:237 start_codon:yes stop_codon:yes gene_type:complete